MKSAVEAEATLWDAIRDSPFRHVAQAYFEEGWPVFPLPPREKSPPLRGVTGYNGVDAGADEIARWVVEKPSANCGLRLPPNVVVVDVDLKPEKGIDGAPTVAALEAIVGAPFPQTWRIARRRRAHGDPAVYGQMLYKVEGMTPAQVAALPDTLDHLGNGVDILRWMHRYAVAPGSVHPEDDDAYMWVDPSGQFTNGAFPSPDELTVLPAEFVAAIAALRENERFRDGVGRATARLVPVRDLDVEGWLAAHASGVADDAEWDDSVVHALDGMRVATGSRHIAARTAQWNLLCLAQEGHAGAVEALAVARSQFIDAKPGGESDWDRMLAEGIQKIAAGEEGERDAEERFWTARPMLTNLRDFARSRRVAPWAMFGCVLARACASIPPNMVLPPLVGGVGSLNTYVALCGNSGGGKSAAMAAAREFLQIEGGLDFLTTGPGSGEGLIGAFMTWRKFPRGGGQFVQSNLSALFVADEVQALGALGARSNSTLLPFLKSAWLGGELATQNADPTRNRRLGSHTYRLVLVAGVQPAHAGVILDDVGGGFPQRWLWMPTYDPSPAQPQFEPDPYPWNPSTTRPAEDAVGNLTVAALPPMEVAAVVAQAVYAARDAQNVPIGHRPVKETLDGHAVFAREKVAALLALLDGGRREVTEADWNLACVVGEKSDETRALVMKALAVEASIEADRRAKRAGKSSAIATDAADEATTLKAMARLRSLLREHGGWLSAGKLQNRLTKSQREYFKDAIERLSGSGEVTTDTVPGRGERIVTRYRLT